MCKQAIDWKKNKNAAYEISQVNFNTTAADYAPVPIGPGTLLFTSDRESKETSESYLWTGRSFSDLYVFKSATQEVAPFDEIINSPDNEGTAILSPDGQMLVFTRCYAGQAYDAWCKLMYSYKRGNVWQEPEPFPFIREEVNYGHPAFAANGTTLFFSSDAPEGQGGHDIYFTQVDGAGIWAEPANLGTFINTCLLYTSSAMVLAYFGLGPIKGFAVTLLIGVVFSFFTAVIVGRLIIEWWVSKGNTIGFSTNLTKNTFANLNVDWLGKRKIAYICSTVFIVVGLISMFTRGFELGVDFRGGYSYNVQFEKGVQVDADKLRTSLTAAFGGTPVVLSLIHICAEYFW